MYAIRAVFKHEDNDTTNYTYYDTYEFDTEQDALDAINGELGEELSAMATIDTENEEDLEGYYFDDLEPYETGTEPWKE